MLNFRYVLEQPKLQEARFTVVSSFLAEQDLLLSRGKIVAASSIEALRATKNKARTRTPAMSSVATGKQWFLGMKLPTAAAAKTGAITKFICTTARIHAAPVLKYLVASGAARVSGAKAYDTRQCAAQLAQPSITSQGPTKLQQHQTLAERRRIPKDQRELSKVGARGEPA